MLTTTHPHWEEITAHTLKFLEDNDLILDDIDEAVEMIEHSTELQIVLSELCDGNPSDTDHENLHDAIYDFVETHRKVTIN